MLPLIETAVRWMRTLWDYAAIRMVGYFLLGFWALSGDPFRLSSTSDQALSAAYHNLQVRLSSVSPPPLTVLTIDNDDIRRAHAEDFFDSDDWPLDYDDHRRLLTWLVDSGDRPPAGVFYDIFFEQPRTSSGDLAGLGERLAKLAEFDDLPPVYLAGGGDYMPISQATQDALGGAQLTPIAWSGLGDYYPLAAPLSPGAHPTATPAPLMYQALCDASNRACRELDLQQPPISLRWGLRSGDTCVPDSWPSRAWSSTARVFASVMQGVVNVAPPPPANPACLPIRTLRLQQLHEYGPAALVPPGVAEDEPYAVMVGVTMPSAGDFHPTPVYESLPGVYLHAMAFENLWRAGDNYLRYHDFTWLSIFVWGLAVMAFMWEGQRRQRAGNQGSLGLTLVWWGAIIAVVLLLQLVFHHGLRIVPEGWLSLAAIMPLLYTVVLRNEVAYQHKKTSIQHTGNP
ncbi:hypothetical protein BWR19_10075 [Halomonas sp. 1513]|nr:CHASE2 domain-containing protein [Halomonas sp. 1513]APX93250.1 hypothetical protein BWR19_10075 [Halomonas sp. 1513]